MYRVCIVCKGVALGEAIAWASKSGGRTAGHTWVYIAEMVSFQNGQLVLRGSAEWIGLLEQNGHEHDARAVPVSVA
jgi:hypothetical protein